MFSEIRLPERLRVKTLFRIPSQLESAWALAAAMLPCASVFRMIASLSAPLPFPPVRWAGCSGEQELASSQGRALGQSLIRSSGRHGNRIKGCPYSHGSASELPAPDDLVAIRCAAALEPQTCQHRSARLPAVRAGEGGGALAWLSAERLMRNPRIVTCNNSIPELDTKRKVASRGAGEKGVAKWS
jgi:hypothetical protein